MTARKMVQGEMFEFPLHKSTGTDLRDHYVAIVESNALAWGDDVRAASEFWFHHQESGYAFTSEMLRHYLTEERGLDEPYHYNAWSAVLGNIIRRWVKAKKARHNGFITSSRLTSHARAIRIYVKL